MVCCDFWVTLPLQIFRAYWVETESDVSDTDVCISLPRDGLQINSRSVKFEKQLEYGVSFHSFNVIERSIIRYLPEICTYIFESLDVSIRVHIT